MSIDVTPEMSVNMSRVLRALWTWEVTEEGWPTAFHLSQVCDVPFQDVVSAFYALEELGHVEKIETEKERTWRPRP